MDSVDLAKVNALRKAKKREIQAWIAAFEEREGRTPTARDKEVVRPMFREFRDLEAKAAAIKDAKKTGRGDAFGASGGTEPGSPEDSPSAVIPSGTGETRGVGLEAQVDVRAERDNKARKIQEWAKEFEDRERHPPTSEDNNNAIASLYGEVENPDKQLATLKAAETAESNAAQEVASDGGDVAKLEGLKAEKKRVKREIKAWLDDFEAREGRPALAEDKATIRPLYKRHKDIERELARISDEASGVQPKTEALVADTNHIHEDPGENPNLVTPMISSPTSSAKEEKVTERKHGTESVGAGIDAQEPVSPILLGSEEKSLSTDSNILHPPFSETAEVPVTAARRNDLVNQSDGSAGVDGQRAGSDGGNSTGARSNGGRGAGLQEEDRRDSGRVDGSGNSADGSVVKQERSRTDIKLPLGELLHNDSYESGSKASPLARNAYEIASKAEAPGDLENAKLETYSTGGAQNITERKDAASPTRVDPSGNTTFVDADVGGVDAREVRGLHSEGGESQKEEESTTTSPPSNILNTVLGAWAPEDMPMAAQKARVGRMRMRFLKMKNLIDDDGEDSYLPWAVTGSTFAEEWEGRAVGDAPEDEAGVRSRWATLGDAIAPNRLQLSPRSYPKREVAFTERRNEMESIGNEKRLLVAEDGYNTFSAGNESVEPLTSPTGDEAAISWISGQTSDLFLSDAPPVPPPAPSGLENLMAEASQVREAVDPPVPGYVKDYQEGVREASLVVASVGVEEVRARERDLELERLTTTREESNVYRARETNLLHREDRARQRVAALQAAGERVIDAGKQAVIEASIARERALAPAFTRARTALEAVIRTQKGRVRELFGELRPGETMGGRRFRVDWRGVPQPVEIRLHCVRAVRDRLRRGSYVMLSSMAERLGGREIHWGKGKYFNNHGNGKDGVDTEGGDSRPAASLPVQHGGRYFDRELRLDQSVYQLCPSKSDVRPGNVMVFELFRLAGSGDTVSDNGGVHCGSSRHKGGELDEDATVGWCVLPIADSRLRIVRGSFRIPMLRGESDPNIDLHEGFEKLIAADLEAWLGNLYLDVRHMPRDVRLEEFEVEGGRPTAGEEGFDVEYDHVRKRVRLGNDLARNTSADIDHHAVDRWTRLNKKRGVGFRVIEDDREILLNQDGTKTINTTKNEADDVEIGLGSGTSKHAERSTDEIQTNDRVDPDGLVLGTTQDTKGATTTETAEGDETEQNKAAGAANEEDNTAGSSMTVKENRQGLGASNRDLDGQKTVGASAGSENIYGNMVVPKLVGGPPPVGSWADVEDDATHTVETLDERCYSDDDAVRGSECLFMHSGEARPEFDTETGGATNASGTRWGGGLRRRGEGARWDSAALGRGSGRKSPRRLGGGSNFAGAPHVWTVLTNPTEMEFYRFAVAADPGTDIPPTPAQVIRQKLRYIQQEILSDLNPRSWRDVDYWLAVMVFVGAIWLRVYLHSLGQWFMLYSVGVSVFNASARLWEFSIKFMGRSSSLEVEIAFVWWGPTFVTLCFACLAGLGRLWNLVACGGKGGGGGEGLPKYFSRFVAAFGVGAVLDPYLLFLVDIVVGNHDCSAKCADYTSPTCICHEGDAWKLYERLETEEGAGIIGILLTIMIYTMSSVVTVLVFHQYLLCVHMNGRLFDLWRRLNAGEDEFFVPHDFEVSAAELHYACVRARKWRGVGGLLRTVVIHDLCANDTEVPGQGVTGPPINRLREGSRNETDHAEGGGTVWKERPKSKVAAPRRASSSDPGTTTHVAIYEVTMEGKKSLHRHFLQTSDGIIFEVFGQAWRGVGWQLRSAINALVQQETGVGGSAVVSSEKVGIFAGMLPDPAPASMNAATGDGDGGGSASAGDNPRCGTDLKTADIGIAGEV